MNILIVKDNFTQKSLLEEQIRSLGHNVTTCVPGTALELYQQTSYALIILDVESANLDEVKLCRQIRALPERDRGLILVIARQNDLQQIKVALEAGADDYLVKPIKMEQLKMRLAAIERQAFRLMQLKVKIKYLTGVLHVIRNTSHLIGREKDYHRLLQSICETLAEIQGVLSAQIDLIDESGFLVKIAESGLTQKFTPCLSKAHTIGPTALMWTHVMAPWQNIFLFPVRVLLSRWDRRPVKRSRPGWTTTESVMA